MIIRRMNSAWAAAVALLVLTVAAPLSFAGGWGGGHGGGGHGGGGGHFGGGAHFGGGHFGGGAHFGAARFGGATVGGARFAGGGARFGVATRFGGTVGGYRGSVGRAGYAGGVRSGGVWHHDGDRWWRGGGNWRWGGGYWGGAYWPPVFWGADFAWFLPVLPAYAPVYWWDNVPYYYYDNGYYTWDADEDGYVATAPPPVAGDDTTGATPAAPEAAPESAPDSAPQSGAVGPSQSDNLYAYPKNGQSPTQQAQDKLACEQWAASQTQGTGSEAASTGSLDYRRALAACLTGRGYSID